MSLAYVPAGSQTHVLVTLGSKHKEASVSFKALDFTSQFRVELWGLKELDHVSDTLIDKVADSQCAK